MNHHESATAAEAGEGEGDDYDSLMALQALLKFRSDDSVNVVVEGNAEDQEAEATLSSLSSVAHGNKAKKDKTKTRRDRRRQDHLEQNVFVMPTPTPTPPTTTNMNNKQVWNGSSPSLSCVPPPPLTTTTLLPSSSHVTPPLGAMSPRSCSSLSPTFALNNHYDGGAGSGGGGGTTTTTSAGTGGTTACSTNQGTTTSSHGGPVPLSLYSPVVPVPEPLTVHSSSTTNAVAAALPSLSSMTTSSPSTRNNNRRKEGQHVVLLQQRRPPHVNALSTTASIDTMVVETTPTPSSSQPPPSTPASAATVTSVTAKTTSMIRVDEITAALKSKPQRGRKRDNLSALERLELTRTRNREHAKSTRIRKKARYQELVNNEQKYQALVKVQELRRQRLECVCRFVSIRESMLRSSLVVRDDENNAADGEEEHADSLSSPLSPQHADSNQIARCSTSNDSSSPPPPPPPPPQRGLVTPQRVVKFKMACATTNGNGSSSSSSSKSSASFWDQDSVSALENVVDLDAFHFCIVGSTLAATTSTTSTNWSNSAFVTMSTFDKSLAGKVEDIMGMDLVRKLSYKVEKMAINDEGTGFAQVAVTIPRDGGCSGSQCHLHVMTAILQFDFVSDSTKLKSVVWHVTEERFERGTPGSNAEDTSDCSSSSSSESSSLGCQMSFPSMVSLDQSGDAVGEK